MTLPDPKSLRSAFSRYMTGVTVVTAQAPDGTPVGFTANSFTSVSLDPPLLLVCPGRHLSSYDVFSSTKHFSVNILAEGQESISNIFASGSDDRFGQTDWTADTNGCALISGRTAGFSCTVTQRVEAGDHMVLLGKVTDFDSSERPGLGYYKGGYFSLSKERQAETPATAARQSVASVILLHQGNVLLTPEDRLPSVQLDDHTGARSALSVYLQSLGLAAHMGPVYSVYDSPNSGVHHVVLRAQITSLPDNCPLKSVPITSFEDGPAKTDIQFLILRRFAQEHRTQSFGLYFGDVKQGEIHQLD
ncbi:MAG: flavin reductase (DIM6/NTAB) family NADH-FMN oxidoreductase RutF [Paracoccaceae bacterium]|jgi:flavin reductase (DIM6/NTAB) family NADH-FMN oxidoreductase RutF